MISQALTVFVVADIPDLFFGEFNQFRPGFVDFQNRRVLHKVVFMAKQFAKRCGGCREVTCASQSACGCDSDRWFVGFLFFLHQRFEVRHVGRFAAGHHLPPANGRIGVEFWHGDV